LDNSDLTDDIDSLGVLALFGRKFFAELFVQLAFFLPFLLPVFGQARFRGLG
jgi:hypothetical protein